MFNTATSDLKAYLNQSHRDSTFVWMYKETAAIIVAMFSDHILAFVFFIPSGICNEHRNTYT